MRLFVYKLTVDGGVAPCVRKGLLSLGICKPSIRTSAEIGDVVFGFAANSLDRRNPLIYIARVTDKVVAGEYYRSKKYAARPDCIYEFDEGEAAFRLRRGVTFHTTHRDLLRDLGRAPNYSRAEVLLSTDFRYFGGEGSDWYKSMYPKIGLAVEKLGQGHRVNHNLDLRDQLVRLKNRIWRTIDGRSSAATTSTKRRACSEVSACDTA